MQILSWLWIALTNIILPCILAAAIVQAHRRRARVARQGVVATAEVVEVRPGGSDGVTELRVVYETPAGRQQALLPDVRGAGRYRAGDALEVRYLAEAPHLPDVLRGRKRFYALPELVVFLVYMAARLIVWFGW